MSQHPNLGPVLLGTILCRDLEACVSAYEKYLFWTCQRRSNISAEQAVFWGQTDLSGAPYAILVNALGEPVLRLVECAECLEIDRLKHTGWLALEIVVQDVDRLARSLASSPFEVLRPVADLAVSDKIRAVQVRGPAGEILYLTQIKADVPPFDLPKARCAVDRVFIPVLCTHNRKETLAFYEDLARHKGLVFDTKITVVNQSYGFALEAQHPVATLQLAGQSLIEIDEITAAQSLPQSPVSGIFMHSFQIDKLPDDIGHKTCPTGTKCSAITIGASGEHIELVEILNG